MALSITVATLVVLEGLLSADNALVLAVMVRHLPKVQQKRALRYGLLGAFAFRLIAVVFAATLLQYWILKVLGGLYLLYMAVAHLAHGEEEAGAERRSRFGNGFWGTVVGVEVTDIAFSIDSILAAVATAEAIPKRYGGDRAVRPARRQRHGRRQAADHLHRRHPRHHRHEVRRRLFPDPARPIPGLAKGAYYLVGWIGLKLLGGGLHDAVHPGFSVGPGNWREMLPPWADDLPLEINGWLFWAVMALIILASLAYKPKRPKDGPKPTPPGELVAAVEKTMADRR